MKKLFEYVLNPVMIALYLAVHYKVIDHGWLNFVIGFQVFLFVIGVLALIGLSIISGQMDEDGGYAISEDIQKSFREYSAFRDGYGWVTRIALFVIMCLDYPVWGTFYFLIWCWLMLLYHSVRTKWLKAQEKLQ